MKYIGVFLLICLINNPLRAQRETIIFWHSMAGGLGQTLNSIVDDFNEQQNEFKVKALFKGDYYDSLTSFSAAFRAHKAPGIIQVFEIGFSLMTNPKGVIRPVDELMTTFHLKIPKENFYPAVWNYYSKNDALQALPLNISVPVIYYNKEALLKININEAHFPKTWIELERMAEQLTKNGYHCAYTTAYPAWILLESFSAIHGLPYVNQEKTKVNFNNPSIIKHLNRLIKWQKHHYFEYGGRVDEATSLFTSGHCPLFSQSLGAYQSLTKAVSFPIGIAPLPLDTDISKQRYNNVVGGGALWAVTGQNPHQYLGIAKFFQYLATPKIQAKWHQQTGYLTLGLINPHQELLDLPSRIATQEFQNDTQLTYQVAFFGQNQVRRLNDEALESIFSGLKRPEEAMKEAANNGNRLLKRQQFMHP